MISIIVPVYNAEKYLKECIDSVLSQTFSDWELLLIDDGSQDSSPLICDKYAAQDKRVKCLHIDNGGPGRARNIGIDAAIGDFVTFVDADDALMNNALEVMHDAAIKSSADVVAACCTYMDADSNTYPYSDICKAEQLTDNIHYTLELLNARTLISLWGKLYRRTYIADRRIDEKMHLGEDFVYLIGLFYNTPGKIAEIDDRLYQYRLLEGSLTHNKRERMRKWNSEIVKKLIAFNDSLDDKSRQLYAAHVCKFIVIYTYNDIEYQGIVKKLSKSQCGIISEYLPLTANITGPKLTQIRKIMQKTEIKRNLYLTMMALFYNVSFDIKTTIKKLLGK